jgi:xanthine dehydrogenase molybdopterin-binding subunit B
VALFDCDVGWQVKKDAEYEERYKEVVEFNSKHKWVKRGISMTHCRYIIIITTIIIITRLSKPN